MDAFAKLVEALSHFISVLVWPSVVLFIVWYFRESIREFLTKFNKGSVKVFGVEASAELTGVAVASIATAQAVKSAQGPDRELSPEQVSSSLEQSAKLIAESKPKVLSKKLVLWVDDNHKNNLNEIKALKNIGFRMSLTLSTRSAIEYLQAGNEPDLIISDLKRPEGLKAGFELAEKVKTSYPSIPVIIYSGMFTDILQTEAIEHGAFGLTSVPSKLIIMVLKATKTTPVFN